MFVLGATPNHIPLKYRCPMKISNQIGCVFPMYEKTIPKAIECNRRATSHMRLKTHDHYTSSTLIGEKGGAGPSSLDIVLEGPTEYVKNARWM